MKYLITGGAGFIGSFLAESLLADGHQVTVLDNLRTGRNKTKGAIFIRGDIRDFDTVLKAVRDADQVFHLAAAVGVRHCLEQPDYAFETNVLGSHNVLKACLTFNRPMLFTSSSSVYGKIEKSNVGEDDDVKYGSPAKLAWAYSYHKAMKESLAIWHGQKGYPIKIVRLFNCIGQRQVGSYGMVVPRFVKFSKAGEPLVVYGDGTQTRTFGDVRDIVWGIRLVMDQGLSGEPYNLGGEDEVSINELAVLIKKTVKSKSPVIHLPFDKAFGASFEETLRRRPNLAKIRKLGYEPRYNLQQTINWIAQGAELKKRKHELHHNML